MFVNTGVQPFTLPRVRQYRRRRDRGSAWKHAEGPTRPNTVGLADILYVQTCFRLSNNKATSLSLKLSSN